MWSIFAPALIDSGFHDAGDKTYKSNFDRYRARELIQNSLDARYDLNKPVHVKFELLKLDRDDIPDIKGLRATFQRCAEYWVNQPKAKDFFENAEAIATAKTITALRVGDYNTTGVMGSDTDHNKNWYHLIRCAGSSSKMGDEGGSFGIGKNAPFAASLMRTVLYSTYNKSREYVFQGVATLVSHTLPGGSIAQPTGYLGGAKGASIRNKADIPPEFLRKQMGTDIIVLGFPASNNWQRDLVHSVCENFWPAIDLKDLVVTVGDEEISEKNLAATLDSFSGEEDFPASMYYRAFKDASFSVSETLPQLRAVSLYLGAGDNDLPKKVAMVRKTGMVIFEKQFRSVIPFCGVFICRNEVGNKLLRDMEPPRHDTWDPDHPSKGENKRVESEYVHFIRECIRNLAPADDAKVISVPGLSRFLPDDDDTPDEAFDGSNGQSKAESLERSPLPEKVAGRKIDPRKTAAQPGHMTPGAGDEDTEGDGDGGGGGKGGGGGGGGGRNGPGKGKTDSDHSKTIIPIRYRTFSTNLAAGVSMLA